REKQLGSDEFEADVFSVELAIASLPSACTGGNAVSPPATPFATGAGVVGGVVTAGVVGGDGGVGLGFEVFPIALVADAGPPSAVLQPICKRARLANIRTNHEFRRWQLPLFGRFRAGGTHLSNITHLGNKFCVFSFWTLE